MRKILLLICVSVLLACFAASFSEAKESYVVKVVSSTDKILLENFDKSKIDTIVTRVDEALANKFKDAGMTSGTRSVTVKYNVTYAGHAVTPRDILFSFGNSTSLKISYDITIIDDATSKVLHQTQNDDGEGNMQDAIREMIRVVYAEAMKGLE